MTTCASIASAHGLFRRFAGCMLTLVLACGLAPAAVAEIVVSEARLPDAEHDMWEGLKEGRIENRAYWAPINTTSAWPAVSPTLDRLVTDLHRRAAMQVAERLAFDGLLLTLANLIRTSGMPDELWTQGPALAFLLDVGFPVDLLSHFAAPGSSPALDAFDRAQAVVRYVHAAVRDESAIVTLDQRLAAVPFVCVPQQPMIRLLAEDEPRAPALVRMHLSAGGYWRGPGDGGVADTVRQVLAATPGVPALLHVRHEQLPDVQKLIDTWVQEGTIESDRRITLIPQSLPLSQWAQDNGKAAELMASGGLTIERRLATYAPRYATRGEDGGTHMPGDSLAVRMLSQHGHVVVQSSLLFQGGNLMVVHSPRDGTRLLLLGEAEVHRNRALGLTEQQILEVFRVECGVDRCIVLPAASFHIDFEVMVRRAGHRSLAFVNDIQSATAAVLEAAIRALEGHGKIEPITAETWRGHLAHRRWAQAAIPLSALLAGQRNEHGQFTTNLAAFFSAGPVDDGVGNLQRILLALDRAVAWSLAAEAALESGPGKEYVAALQRREDSRAQLWAVLTSEGFELVPIPGCSDGAKGTCPLNGVHNGNFVMLNGHGGILAGVDEAAANAIKQVLDDEGHAQVMVIRCAETQRREGGLHCATVSY